VHTKPWKDYHCGGGGGLPRFGRSGTSNARGRLAFEVEKERILYMRFTIINMTISILPLLKNEPIKK